ncbi:transposase [Duganella sp. HSC-15S17]|nr:transposase [Duganella violaceicalia]
MVRVLLIQQLFNLSDEQMECQLLDRLSFQRFVGLRSSSQIPDRTTIRTFKERLIQAGASASIFDALNRQLSTPASCRRPNSRSTKKRKPSWPRTRCRPIGRRPSGARKISRRAGPRSTASPTSATSSRPTPTSATRSFARSRSAPELESRRIQSAAPLLPEGGQDRGVLTPEVRPDCRKRRIRITKLP